MYNYPYGDNQQINLNWIISEIIALHQQLDPDYTAPTFTQIYPFSETQQLNLDWILAELKTLKDLAPTPPPTELIDEIGQALIAGAYDADTSYQKNDYIVQDGKVYRANAATTGTFDPTKWNEVMLGNDLAIITRWADATNTFLNSLAASNVANDSSVTGTTVKDALNTLKTATDAAVTNVKYNAGYLKKTIGGADSNIIQIEDSPTNDSAKLPSSKAVYNLNSQLSSLQTADAAIENSLAIIANGDEHPAIASGQYVYIKNHTTLAEGLYLATTTIPLNTAITAASVTAINAGGLNSINDQLNIRTGFASPTSLVTSGSCQFYRIGRIVVLTFTLNGTFASGDTLATALPLTPAANNVQFFVSNNNDWTINPRLRVTNTGELKIDTAVTNASLRGFIFYLTTTI